ncbi:MULTISPECIES: hypothetical protein [Halorussus]|uniref:hypothetical protein n=1 Tax=Halorussus TaxID=1070314 RepID=UPI000E20D0B0|nr:MULTISPECIES: hypothetical protein [Halorussus]NHN57610.1 hypothetical protein [Halorussus sp. JP-T4]
MPVGGYDPEDLDEKLEAAMETEGTEPSNWLTDEERREWDDGENLVDLLDEEDIHDLLGEDGDDRATDEPGS